MAPPRRKREKANERRFFKIALPEDIAARIEAKAKVEGRPQNRIIINELAAVPRLEQYEDYEELLVHHDNALERMEVTLAQYSGRIEWLDLSEKLVNAVDEVLITQGGAQQATIDRLRVIRTGMLAHERATKREGREPHK